MVTEAGTPQEVVRLLGKCLVFRALDEPARAELASRIRRQSYRPGEPIFHVGAPGQSMMVILQGTVRVSLPSPNGRTIILADLGVGDVLGEVTLLDGRGRSADAAAITNCSLAVLERRDVLPFLERRPEVCLTLLELMCARLRRSDERMAEIAFFDLPARLAKVVLEKVRESGAARTKPRLSLSQSELAAMINGTRENVNRCLRDWQRRGIVEIQDRWIIIAREEALRELVDQA
jgi:CRP/FNR family transcriptional regulator, cyclic AMP receptor protein